MSSPHFHHRQQLPRTAGTHEPVVGGEVIGAFGDGWEADENHGAGIEAFRLVDRGVADGVGRNVRLCDFAEVSAAEDAFVAERAAGDVGLFVEDEHFFRAQNGVIAHGSTCGGLQWRDFFLAFVTPDRAMAGVGDSGGKIDLGLEFLLK